MRATAKLLLDNGVAKALGVVAAMIVFGLLIGFGVSLLKAFLDWF